MVNGEWCGGGRRAAADRDRRFTTEGTEDTEGPPKSSFRCVRCLRWLTRGGAGGKHEHEDEGNGRREEMMRP
jgi:hypothetical protein